MDRKSVVGSGVSCGGSVNGGWCGDDGFLRNCSSWSINFDGGGNLLGNVGYLRIYLSWSYWS